MGWGGGGGSVMEGLGLSQESGRRVDAGTEMSLACPDWCDVYTDWCDVWTDRFDSYTKWWERGWWTIREGLEGRSIAVGMTCSR